MTVTENQSPPRTADVLLSQVSDMLPRLLDRSDESERKLQLPAETISDLNAMNFVGAAVPAARGGLGLGFDVIGAATRRLAEACGSTAWVTGNCALHSHMVGYFSLEVQEHVFLESNTVPFVGNGLKMTKASATKVEGGFRLTGRWDFSSGIVHSDWTMVAAISDVGPFLFLVHKSQFTIDMTWDPHGLRGTGSHDTVVDDEFIKEPYAIPLASLGDGSAPGLKDAISPYHRIPIFTLAPTGIVNTVIGASRRAVATFEGRSTTAAGAWDGTFPASRPGVQELLGRASATLAACEALSEEFSEELAEKANGESGITMQDRARWRRDQTYITVELTKMVSDLFALGGAHTLVWRNPLNRAFREVTAASHHYASQPDIVYPAYSKVQFGRDPEYTVL